MRIVREVLVALAVLVGKEIGLARFTVLLPGAPANDRRIVPGSPVVADPGSNEMLTVYEARSPLMIVSALGTMVIE